MPLRAIIDKLERDELKSLNIETDVIKDEYWLKILKAVQNNDKLRELHLRDMITDERAEQLAAALRENNKLTHVDIISAHLTHKGEGALLDALVNPPHANLLEAQIWAGSGVDASKPVSGLHKELEALVEDNMRKAKNLAKATEEASKPDAEPLPEFIKAALHERKSAVHRVIAERAKLPRDGVVTL